MNTQVITPKAPNKVRITRNDITEQHSNDSNDSLFFVSKGNLFNVYYNKPSHLDCLLLCCFFFFFWFFFFVFCFFVFFCLFVVVFFFVFCFLFYLFIYLLFFFWLLPCLQWWRCPNLKMRESVSELEEAGVNKWSGVSLRNFCNKVYRNQNFTVT